MQTIAVIGAGTMGHGIAQVAALSGYRTVLCDVSEDQLLRAKKSIVAGFEKSVAKKKVSEAAVQSALSQLYYETSIKEGVSGAALVIEAVPEKLNLKREIFEKVARWTSSDTVLASNTSSLSVTEIAAATPCPERVIGMHFFNPPIIIKLLEIVRAEQTEQGTVEKAQLFGEHMGRDQIVVQDSPGFASSRLGLVLGLEAIRMLEQGVASAEDIDTAMQSGYRHPMGPLKLTDLVGLDVRLAIAEHLHRELNAEQFRPPALLRDMVEQGKLGKKSGEGFYTWAV